MADEQEQIVDVTGQPGGPSPEEQALADAEQLELMQRLAAERAPIEEAARRALQEKLDKAKQERTSLIETVRALVARVEALEAKVG